MGDTKHINKTRGEISKNVKYVLIDYSEIIKVDNILTHTDVMSDDHCTNVKICKVFNRGMHASINFLLIF